MKTGRTLVDLAGELERQMSSKRDLVVPSSLLQCRTDEGGELKMLVDVRSADTSLAREYGVTDLARRQLADKLKIPFAYFERMRSEIRHVEFSENFFRCRRIIICRTAHQRETGQRHQSINMTKGGMSLEEMELLRKENAELME
jgi:hypothetical protein